MGRNGGVAEWRAKFEAAPAAATPVAAAPAAVETTLADVVTPVHAEVTHEQIAERAYYLPSRA